METNPRIIDTHAHLPLLTHAGLPAILQNAQEAGIYRMVTVSTEPKNWESNRELAEKFEHLYYSLGLHPHDAKTWNAVKTTLADYFPGGQVPPKCVAIGETGLDFYYDLAIKAEQLQSFYEQIDLANQLKLPVIIHCRDAFEETYAAVRAKSPRGVMHCFTGDLTQAKTALDLGLKISFSGIVTFKNAQSLQAVAQAIPEEAILVETDCPFLAPIPMRGKPNEPAHLVHTVRRLAELRGIAFEAMAEITTRNALEFFRLN